MKVCGKELDTDRIWELYELQEIKNELKTNEYAEEILDQIEEFNENIQEVERRSNRGKGEKLPYFQSTHAGKINEKTTQKEDKIAKQIYNQGRINQIPGLGYILDYQIPIGSNDMNGRKIDLISYEPNNCTIYLLELKNESSNESMLRCVMEGYTYFKWLNKADFMKEVQEKFSQLSIPTNVKIRTAPLVFKGKKQECHYTNPGNTSLIALMNKLDIKPIFIKKISEDKYSVV